MGSMSSSVATMTSMRNLAVKGRSHKQPPPTPALLLDPHILTIEAFASLEKNAVPQRRDGSSGRELQKGMVAVARRRLFDHDMVTSVTNGGQWFSLLVTIGLHLPASVARHTSMWNPSWRGMLISRLAGHMAPTQVKDYLDKFQQACRPLNNNLYNRDSHSHRMELIKAQILSNLPWHLLL